MTSVSVFETVKSTHTRNGKKLNTKEGYIDTDTSHAPVFDDMYVRPVRVCVA